MDPECLDHHNPPRMEKQKWWVKTAAWRTFRGRLTLHQPVKNKRVTVQGPVTKPQMDYMSHRGGGASGRGAGSGASTKVPPISLKCSAPFS